MDRKGNIQIAVLQKTIKRKGAIGNAFR